ALKVIADAKEALLALIDELQVIEYQSSYTVEIDDAKKAWETELARLHNIRFTGQGFTPEVEGHFDENLNEYVDALGTQLTQTAVIGQLNTLLGEVSIIVGAAGSLPGDLQRMWAANKPNTYHMEYGYSCMGYE
ncbi:3D-(3,5/4)-trihydroxycyclohexane-1,2-dione acylhydrolase (decyclizing), partial [Bacillus toyonensis]